LGDGLHQTPRNWRSPPLARCLGPIILIIIAVVGYHRTLHGRCFSHDCREILGHCTLLPLLICPIEFCRRFAMIAAGVPLDHAGIDRETFALGQAHSHRGPHDTLEDVAQHVAIAKTAEPIGRKC